MARRMWGESERACMPTKGLACGAWLVVPVWDGWRKGGMGRRGQEDEEGKG